MTKMIKMMNMAYEMNDEMAAQVIGGAHTSGNARKFVFIHDGCGGKIINHSFWFAECDRCGERHWLMSDFKGHGEYVEE